MDKIYFRVKAFRNRNNNLLPRKLNFNPTAVASCDASIFFEKVEDLFLITVCRVVRCHAKMKCSHFFLKCKHLRSNLKRGCGVVLVEEYVKCNKNNND